MGGASTLALHAGVFIRHRDKSVSPLVRIVFHGSNNKRKFMNNGNDYLTQVVLSDEAKKIISKNFRLSKALLICAIIYCSVATIGSLAVFTFAKPDSFSSFKFMMLYRINPSIQLIILAATFYCYTLLVAGYKKLSVSDNNQSLFNDAFRLFYKMNFISLITFLLSIISSIAIISIDFL
jgi:hypothetical protein